MHVCVGACKRVCACVCMSVHVNEQWALQEEEKKDSFKEGGSVLPSCGSNK